MQTEVNLFVMDVVGQKTIASPPRVMAKIKTYAWDARSSGLSDTEIAEDISLFWPNIRRVVSVETSTNGDIWVTMMSAEARFRPPARSQPEPKARPKVMERAGARGAPGGVVAPARARSASIAR